MELCNFSSSENCQCFKVTPIFAFSALVTQLLNEKPKRSRDISAMIVVHSSVSSVTEWQLNRMSAVYRIPSGIAVTTASPVTLWDVPHFRLQLLSLDVYFFWSSQVYKSSGCFLWVLKILIIIFYKIYILHDLYRKI